MKTFHKWQTIKTTEDLDTEFYQEVSRWPDKWFVSTIAQPERIHIPKDSFGYVLKMEDNFPVIVVQYKEGHVVVYFDKIAPYYETFERPLYINATRDANVSFTTTTVKRGWASIKRVYEAITPLGGFIAGGYASWMAADVEYQTLNRRVILDNPPRKDADIFLTDGSEEKVKAIGTALGRMGFKQVSQSPIVTTYAAPDDMTAIGCPAIQVVTPRSLKNGSTTGTPEQVIDSFDFTVSRAALLDENTVIVDTDLRHDVAGKHLHLKNMHCPLGSSIRVSKYEQKGYHVSHFQRFLILGYARTQTEKMDDLGLNLMLMQDYGEQQYWLADMVGNTSETFVDAVDPEVVNGVYFGLYLD